MSMIKTSEPTSLFLDEPVVTPIKLSTRGLIGNDLRSFIKKADVSLANTIRNLTFHPGEVPIYLIALGATETVGPNRNLDGFTKAACKRYHDTFVKYARMFRNHQNKIKENSYGIVKHSNYNDKMGRIELIVALNGTKEAADKNNGKVADEELDMLSSKLDKFAVSMSCKVAYDVCSVCGNKSKTRAEYCLGTEEGGSCPGGGCRHNLGKVAEDGTITYVDNPHPTWFDISRVFRPADRIAYVFGELTRGVKSASSTRVLGGAELSDLFGIKSPLELTMQQIPSSTVREQVKIAVQLAEIENDLYSGNTKYNWNIPANDYRIQDNFFAGLGRDKYSRAKILKAFSNEKIALSLPNFIKFISQTDDKSIDRLAKKTSIFMPGLFSRLTDDLDLLVDDLKVNPFSIENIVPDGESILLAKKAAADCSLDVTYLQKRAWTNAIRNNNINLLSPEVDLKDIIKNKDYELLAKSYGLYKIAFLHSLKDTNDFDLLANLVVRQNHIRL